MAVREQERIDAAATPAEPDGGVRDIAGVRDLWASIVTPADARDARPVPVRPLLDTLGVGLEQTYSYLSEKRPSFNTFVAWIVATAGNPDPDRIERYLAWYSDLPIPAAEVARQAAVMAQAQVFGAEDLADWERDGVVVLRHAIERDQAAAVAAHLWDVLRASPDDPQSWYGSRANGIMIQHFQHPSMDVARQSLRVAKGFAELYGHADLIVSTDRLSFNPPEHDHYAFPGPHLHWDASLSPPMPFETQAILYLTDTAADQGPLQVVPGFHHRLAAGWLDSLGEGDPRSIDLAAESVPVPAGAGDLVIWRQELPHGASPNKAAQPRMAQYVNLYPMRWPDTRPWR